MLWGRFSVEGTVVMVRNEKERMQPSQPSTSLSAQDLYPRQHLFKKKTYPTPGFALVHFDFNSSPFFKKYKLLSDLCGKSHTTLGIPGCLTPGVYKKILLYNSLFISSRID